MTSLPPGARLGHYDIQGSLGAGGMGEVYRARDSKLNRVVALKILPEAFTADADRLARFKREAQVLASLNHSNIAAIYGLEDSAATHALVMELVEGEDLSALIARGPMSPADAMPIARQIAEALGAAHEAGIVHRDLKPANIKVRPDGTVKVLDFGLAKAMSHGAEAPGLRSADPGPRTLDPGPTMTSPAMTELGMVLGTAAYMSPEQARGRPVDRRADIWAFGVVLYEMLTGQRLFRGETVSDTLAAVLRQEISWTALPDGTPPATRRLLRRCLERDPAKRLHDIVDARLELDEPVVQEVPTATPSRPGLRVHAAWAVALIAVAGLLWWLRPAPAPNQWQKFTQLTDAAGVEDFPALSPNGELVAYVSTSAGSSDIFVQRPGGRRPTVVAGDPKLDETSPAFSPDSARIAYNLATATGGIFVAGATGESSRRLTDKGYHPAWSPDGSRIAYGTEVGSSRVDLQACKLEYSIVSPK